MKKVQKTIVKRKQEIQKILKNHVKNDDTKIVLFFFFNISVEENLLERHV